MNFTLSLNFFIIPQENHKSGIRATIIFFKNPFVSMRFIISINKHWVMTTHASVCTYAHYIQQVFLYFNIDLTSTFSNTMANHAYYSSFTFINMSILQSKNSSCFTKKLWTLTENCGLLFIPLLKKHKILTYESILDIQKK